MIEDELADGSNDRYEKEFDNVADVFELQVCELKTSIKTDPASNILQALTKIQRNLNNAFAYDLVPSPSVITAALKAARRVNDFPTAVRIFEGDLPPFDTLRTRFQLTICDVGIKAKVENKGQYDEYLRDLEPLREELGVNLKEDLYPEQVYTAGANTHA